MSSRAWLELTEHILTDNPNIGHIKICIQGFSHCCCRLFCLSVFGTETISSDVGSTDISDTFKLLSSVKKMWEYPSDI